MPEELNIESGSRTTRGIEAYKKFVSDYVKEKGPDVDLLNIPEKEENAVFVSETGIDTETWALGRAAYRNTLRYGCATWYPWCNKHWGTKWNAYDCHREGETISFNTAWNAPHPVIEKLAEMFPEANFIHRWADEDLGYNCGMREYADGNIVEEYIPENRRTAMEFAAEVRGIDLEDYGWALNEDGTDYVYAE